MAAGADVILIPEIPFSIEDVCQYTLDREKDGHRFTIICVAEGAYPIDGQQTYDGGGSGDRLGGVTKFLGRTYRKVNKIGNSCNYSRTLTARRKSKCL